MSIQGPSIIDGAGKVNPRLLDQAIRELYRHAETVKQIKQMIPGLEDRLTPSEMSAPLKQLEESNVQNFIGKLSEVQLGGAPVYTSTPPNGDPNLQDTALLIINEQLYRVDGTNDPPVLIPLGTAVQEVNVTPVQVNANSTADQDLMSVDLPAGVLNRLGKVLHLTAAGLWTSQAGQTPLLRFRVFYGSTQLISIETNAVAAAKTNFAWSLEAFLVTASTGATGTLECYGLLSILLTDAAGSSSEVYNDRVTGASSAVDLTAAETVQITGRFSTQPAGTPFNILVQRMLVTEVLN